MQKHVVSYVTKLFMSNSTRPVSDFLWAYQSLIPDFSTMNNNQLEWKSLKQLQNEGSLTITKTQNRTNNGNNYLNITVEILDGYFPASVLEQNPIFTFLSMSENQNNVNGTSGFVWMYLEY